MASTVEDTLREQGYKLHNDLVFGETPTRVDFGDNITEALKLARPRTNLVLLYSEDIAPQTQGKSLRIYYLPRQ